MTVSIPDINQKQAAIIAGISLLIMTIIAPIANFSVLGGLLVEEDAAATAANIISAEGKFRISVILFILVAILDILIAWSLFIYLRDINKGLSLLAGWLRLVYAGLLAVSVFYLIQVLQMVGIKGYLTGSNIGYFETQVYLSVKSFKSTWESGLIIFGFHLLVLGYLFILGGYMRKILGILLVIAAIGYVVDGTGRLLSPDYTAGISLYTFVGEVILIFWLLIKGWRIKSVDLG